MWLEAECGGDAPEGARERGQIGRGAESAVEFSWGASPSILFEIRDDMTTIEVPPIDANPKCGANNDAH